MKLLLVATTVSRIQINSQKSKYLLRVRLQNTQTS